MKIKKIGEVLDTYWPVIEEARKVRDYYMGRNPPGPPIVCKDCVGDLIRALRDAENILYVEREKKDEA